MKRLLVVLLFLLLVTALLVAATQVRYRYERREAPVGVFTYYEIYEQRSTDVDGTATVTSQRQERVINKQARIAELTEERAALVAQANALQQRINDLSALP